jgi:hypothetical protein
MRPVGVSVLSAFRDTDLGLQRIAEQKVGQRISRVRATVGIDATGIVGIRRIEVEMEEIAAELQAVAPTLNRDVVVEFEVSVDAAGEPGGVAHGGELVTERHLWKARVFRVRCCALDAVDTGEGISRVRIGLTARHAHPPRAEFIHD